MSARLYVPRTLKEAKKEIERQQAVNLKYADLFEQRENELKAEIQQLTERYEARGQTIDELLTKIEAAKTILNNPCRTDKHKVEELSEVFSEEESK